MTCTGQMIATGTPVHHACLECGHRAGAHTLHPDGNVSCDTCSTLDRIDRLDGDLTWLAELVITATSELRRWPPPSRPQP